MPAGPVMSVEAIDAFLRQEFPQIYEGGPLYAIEAIGVGTARLRMPYHPRHLRPGGTLSGPSMMGLADVALYVAILASIGPVALAVTTNLSFNFLRKPAQRDLLGEARLLKLGRRLAVGEVSLRSDGAEDVVCHATGTYSIPAVS
jgi:uncharacterized protein (TIGR00369 family)